MRSMKAPEKPALQQDVNKNNAGIVLSDVQQLLGRRVGVGLAVLLAVLLVRLSGLYVRDGSGTGISISTER